MLKLFKEGYMTVLRISAKTADGKVLVPRTREEPFFFNFGKSEVGELSAVTMFGFSRSFSV